MDQTQPVEQKVQSQQISPVQPVTTVSQLDKESEPMPSIGNTNWAEVSHPAPEVSQELKEAGVEKVAEHPQIHPEVVEAGVALAKDATPVATQPAGLVNIPWTEEKAQEVIKTNHDPKHSVYWLATLIFHEIEAAKRRKQVQPVPQEGELV